MEFKRKKDFLVCIDSDGCAMDTMNIKHFEAFGPELIKIFNLEKYQDDILEHWNKVNLFSKTRGVNRFIGFLKSLEYANEKYNLNLDLTNYKNYIESGKKTKAEAMKEEYEKTNDEIFKKAYEWSLNVNDKIKSIPKEKNKSFNGVYETLKLISEKADVAIVSSANLEAVKEEWTKENLIDFVDVICTQEFGTKKESIEYLLKTGVYEKDHVLKIGDAPGDLKAARDNGVYFYPIIAKEEENSWKNLKETYLDKFFNGEYEKVDKELEEKFYQTLEKL